MRIFLLGLVLFTGAACEPEPRNIQADAANYSRQLEERAEQIARDAENATDAAAAELDRQSEMLANQADALREGGNAAAVSETEAR